MKFPRNQMHPLSQKAWLILIGLALPLMLMQVVSGQSCTNEGTTAGSESCDADSNFTLTLQDVVAIDVTDSLTASTDVIRTELDQRYLPIGGTFVVNIFSITDYTVSVTNAVTTGTLIGTGNADTVVELGNLVISNNDDGADDPTILAANCAAGVITSGTGETCQDVTTAGIVVFNGGNSEGGAVAFHTVTGQIRVDKDGLGNTSTDPGTAQQSFTFTLTFRVTEN